MCVCARARARVFCAFVYVHACVRMSVRVCVRLCVCVRARACVRACECLRVRCVCIRACVRVERLRDV